MMSIASALYVVALTPDEAHEAVVWLERQVKDYDDLLERPQKKSREMKRRRAMFKAMLDRMDPHIACGGADYVVADGERRLNKYAKAMAMKALKL